MKARRRFRVSFPRSPQRLYPMEKLTIDMHIKPMPRPSNARGGAADIFRFHRAVVFASALWDDARGVWNSRLCWCVCVITEISVTLGTFYT